MQVLSLDKNFLSELEESALGPAGKWNSRMMTGILKFLGNIAYSINQG